jgi:uncharacterized glyoxalase superfamily protein PhnB
VAEQRVVPMFSYEDVGRAADWIAAAFGFEETGRWSDESNRVTHVNMELDGGVIMLGFPSPDYQSPKHHAEVCEPARTWRQTPYIVDGVHVSVDDVDAHYGRAVAAYPCQAPVRDCDVRVRELTERAERSRELAEIGDDGIGVLQLLSPITARRHADTATARGVRARNVERRVADSDRALGGPAAGTLAREVEELDAVLAFATEGALPAREQFA